MPVQVDAHHKGMTIWHRFGNRYGTIGEVGTERTKHPINRFRFPRSFFEYFNVLSHDVLAARFLKLCEQYYKPHQEPNFPMINVRSQ